MNASRNFEKFPKTRRRDTNDFEGVERRRPKMGKRVNKRLSDAWEYVINEC